ncbi:MAG: class I SAM-dependent methyltransferase [Rhodospirillaceae bacterium]|nr:class I SAM-dependent methyltransferase [Rhodospirillaceae bacterium]MBT7292839.1 class I SAM-dependent methyltransferase [Rhodospirillaceae bacterium]
MGESESKQHWQKAHTRRAGEALSWYQQRPSVSLAMIEATGLGQAAAIIDVGGGASTLVDHLIAAGYSDITVLDIAASAIDVARQRLAAKAENVAWLSADATEWAPARRYDIWHDRAVFHFLTEVAQRRAYVERLEAALAEGGQAIFATFALDGPERCSGLPVQRYDGASLARELGAAFTLVESRRETHETPGGMAQKFHYSRFARR